MKRRSTTYKPSIWIEKGPNNLRVFPKKRQNFSRPKPVADMKSLLGNLI